MKILALALGAMLTLTAAPASAAELSTHVLDLARGVGGKDVPVVLSRKNADGAWTEVASGLTDPNGRVRSFGEATNFELGDYRLTFDMSRYPDADVAPFFPEIVVSFRVSDSQAHYHVPVVVSPYGYSTYRGN